jgi:hypothetical protein
MIWSDGDSAMHRNFGVPGPATLVRSASPMGPTWAICIAVVVIIVGATFL